jgi:hypothetical protein
MRSGEDFTRVFMRVAFGTYKEYAAFEKDEFEQRQDSKGAVNEDLAGTRVVWVVGLWRRVFFVLKASGLRFGGRQANDECPSCDRRTEQEQLKG